MLGCLSVGNFFECRLFSFLYTSKFLQMILDQDLLLSTRKEFLLGEYIRQADTCGSNPTEKRMFINNAKRQITSWTSVNSSLHEYAHKEWNGILSTLYAPRWKVYFDYLHAKLEGKNPKEIDFFAMETCWIESKEKFSAVPVNKEIEIAKTIYHNYADEINQVYLK